MSKILWFSALISALLAPSAWAHMPHDPAYWLAFSPGKNPQWVVTTMPLTMRQCLMLARTSDRENIETRYLLDEEEGAPGGAMLDATRLVVTTRGRGLWMSDDVGDNFVVHPDVPADASLYQVVASPEVLADGLALAVGYATEKGIPIGHVWRTNDGGDSWQVTGSFTNMTPWDVKLSPSWSSDGVAAMLTSSGEVFTSSDYGQTWQQKGSMSGGVFQIAPGNGRIWMATADHGLCRSLDGGATFTSIGYDDKPVSTVAEFPGDLVMFARSDEAVYVSRDGGETWEFNPEQLEWTAPDQPTSGIHYYDIRQDGDGVFWLAAWEGLVKSDDEGRTWRHIETCLPETTRDISLTKREDDSLAAITAGFGGGSLLLDEATRTVRPIGLDLPAPYFKRSAASHDWDRDGITMLTVLQWLTMSHDNDATWVRAAKKEMGDYWHVAVSPDFVSDPTIFSVGNVGDGGGWCTSADGGGSWSCHVSEGESTFCSAGHLSENYNEDGYAWAACGDQGELHYTSDFGEHWNTLGEASSAVWGLGGTEFGEKLFIAAADGLYLSEASATPKLVAFEGEAVWDVAVSPQWQKDPAVYALLPKDGLYRSLDGGESWDQLDIPTAAPAQTVALSPTYAEDGSLAIATFEGSWLSRDRGESWADIHALEVIPNYSPLWTYSLGWVEEEIVESMHERRSAASAGATATLLFRGVGLDLYSAYGEDLGLMGVTLDGEPQGQIDLTGEEAHRVKVWAVRGLADDWHTLDVTVELGTGVIDAAFVWRLEYDEAQAGPIDTGGEDSQPDSESPHSDNPDSQAPDSDTPPADSADQTTPRSRCNCATGRAGWAWPLLLPGLLLVWRRRSGAG